MQAPRPAGIATIPMPPTVAHYDDPNYWDARYRTQPARFDWYNSFWALKGLFQELRLPTDQPILHVGVGLSTLQDDMSREGFTDITSIDYSATCIDRLKQLVPNCKGGVLKYAVADIRDLGPDFPNVSFSVVIDKGTLDSILCGGAFQGVEDALSEVCRVLCPGGMFICVTYGSPRTRLRHFENDDYPWSVEVYTIEKVQVGTFHDTGSNSAQVLWGGPFIGQAETSALDVLDCHFVYVCRKPEAE